MFGAPRVWRRVRGVETLARCYITYLFLPETPSFTYTCMDVNVHEATCDRPDSSDQHLFDFP